MTRIRLFAGTHTLIIDTQGFAWTIDCADVGGPARRVSAGETMVDGRKTLAYHSFRTGETYIMQDGELVKHPEK